MKNSTPAAQGNLWIKVAGLAVVAAVLGAAYFLFKEHLSLDSLAEREASLRQFQRNHPVLVYLIAFLIYVAITGLSLPGAVALTLGYAWYFGFFPAVILVSFASTTGATVAFLLSRYLFRDGIQKKFGDQLTKFNEALDREGAFYLFTLRLIPAVPFFVINVVMGLTRIRTVTFWWVSQLGMLAGTIVYVYAGSTIPSLSHLADSSQLRPADVLDWTALVATLQESDNASSPAGRIRELLSDDMKTMIDSVKDEPSADAKMQIITGLNQLVTRPDLAIDEPWRKAVVYSGNDDEERRTAAKRLTKANRDLLVAAFPKIISPPRPILSPQLIAAFVILGLFPLVVKKVMQRFRKTPENKDKKQENSDKRRP